MEWKYYKPKFEYEGIINPYESAWAGHVFFAYDLVRNTKPKRIVELGTHFGHSFFAFCQAVKDEGLKTELAAVDTWKGDKHSGFYDESVYNTVKKIKNTVYKDLKISLVRKTFDEALSEFDNDSIDILHIDGLHTYEAVKHDFENWLGKVKKNGIILLHDTSVTTEDFGVYKLWDEIKEKYKTLEFEHSHGLGVMFKSPKRYKGINLFKEVWQNYYNLFSENKLIKQEISSINREIQEKDNELKKLFTSEQQKNQDLAELRNFLRQKDDKISNLKTEIGHKGEEIKQRDQIIQQRNVTVREKEKEARRKEKIIRQKDAEIVLMKSSKFWILRNRYIKLKYFRPKHFIQLASKALGIISAGKFQKFWWAMKKYVIYGWDYFKPKTKPKTDYEKWIEKNEKFNKKEIEKEIEGFRYKPKISIITPVYNVDPKWLDKCIHSVRNQFYENWELCLHDDASTNKETIKCLKKWKEKSDPRIKISFGKENQHISGASNETLKLATGDFVALLDNDDELSPDALYENVKLLNEYPEADFIYSDEDKIKMDGRRVDPFFKPDWSREFFLTTMYTCHLGIYRKSIVDEINGFRKGFEGSQDYDLVLRFIEKVDHKRIFHISKILYHWRKIEGSTAQKTNSKNYAYIAGKKALVDYLERNNISGNVEDGISPGAFRIKRNLKNHPLVSIIIPTKDKIDYLRPCVLSIVKKTDYPNVEIIIIDTGSREKATYDFYDEIKNDEKIKIIDYQKSEFNFAEANNWAAQKVKGKYLLFLNNDTEVINADWLTSMMEYAQLKDVGVVGSKLLFPNNTIQHMGVVIGLRGGASHAGICFPEWQFMGFPFLHAKDVVRDVSSVTAACLLIRKKIFDKVNGFNEKFKIAFNDTDLCLKVKKLGYKIIYTPYAKLIHHESVSFGRPYDDPRRSNDLFEKERRIFNSKWKISEDYHDPFYNVNLTTRNENLSLKI